MNPQDFFNKLYKYYELSDRALAEQNKPLTDKRLHSAKTSNFTIIKAKPRERICPRCHKWVDFLPVVQIQRIKEKDGFSWKQKCSSPCFKYYNELIDVWENKNSFGYVKQKERDELSKDLPPGSFIDAHGRIKKLKLPVEAVKDILTKRITQKEYMKKYEVSQGCISQIQNGNVHPSYGLNAKNNTEIA